MEVTNTSPYTIKLYVNETAKDSNGNMIGADSTSEYGFPSGCTIFIRTIFSDITDVQSYDTIFHAVKDTIFVPVLQNLVIKADDLGNGVVISATNTGNVSARFPEAMILYFKDGQIIKSHTGFVMDDDKEIKPGATATKQFTNQEEYDSIKIHFTASGY